MLFFFEEMEVVEIFFLKKKAYGKKIIYCKYIRCIYTLELPHSGNSDVYLEHMLLKIRKKTI